MSLDFSKKSRLSACDVYAECVAYGNQYKVTDAEIESCNLVDSQGYVCKDSPQKKDISLYVKGNFRPLVGQRKTPVEMWWHTVTHGRGSEGETGEWSG